MADHETTTIVTILGPSQVLGFRVAGHFFIHDAVGQPGVAVTHIATGMRLVLADGISVAIEAAYAYARFGDVWEFTDPQVGHDMRYTHGPQCIAVADAVARSSLEELRRVCNGH